MPSSSEELWQTYSSNGEVQHKGVSPIVARADNSVIEGAVHLWIWRTTESGAEVLLQKRARDKATFPGMLDISAAGHVNFGESLLEALARECREEINLEIDTNLLEYLFSYRDFKSGLKWVYLYQPSHEAEFIFNDGEVEMLEWVSLDTFEKLTNSPSTHNLVPHPSEYYSLLKKAIKNFQHENH